MSTASVSVFLASHTACTTFPNEPRSTASAMRYPVPAPKVTPSIRTGPLTVATCGDGVPGALEIPGTISLASESDLYDGYVAIGVVIRGETYHFEIVAGESARGIMALTMDGMAIGNGILTVENEEQALVRADPKQKDKGGEAAKAAIALLDLRTKFAG